jgi:hypothetical protein
MATKGHYHAQKRGRATLLSVRGDDESSFDSSVANSAGIATTPGSAGRGEAGKYSAIVSIFCIKVGVSDHRRAGICPNFRI